MRSMRLCRPNLRTYSPEGGATESFKGSSKRLFVALKECPDARLSPEGRTLQGRQPPGHFRGDYSWRLQGTSYWARISVKAT